MSNKALIKKLQATASYEIIFTKHAKLRLFQRQLQKEQVINDLKNPYNLKLAELLKKSKNEEKYKLWFVPYKRIAYIYIIVINHNKQKIIVKTVVKQRLDWQKKVEKYG